MTTWLMAPVPGSLLIGRLEKASVLRVQTPSIAGRPVIVSSQYLSTRMTRLWPTCTVSRSSNCRQTATDMTTPIAVAVWLPICISVISAAAAVAAWLAAWAQAKASKAQLQIMERQDFNDAAAAFRAQFTDVLFRLRQNLNLNNRNVIDILGSEVLTNHEQAKILFEPHLSSTELKALEAAWQAYARSPKSPSPGNVDQRRLDTQKALEQIDALLEFSRPR